MKLKDITVGELVKRCKAFKGCNECDKKLKRICCDFVCIAELKHSLNREI